MFLMANFYNYFKVFIYILFVYSGLFKWLPIPVDITLLSGLLCALIFFFDLVSAKKRINKNNKLEFIKLIFLVFCVWYLFTALYTSSENFWLNKARAILLLICAFYFPFVSLKNTSVKLIFSIFLTFSLGVVLILSYLYLNNLLYLIIAETDEFRAENKIPDYLAISEFLSCAYFITFIYQNKLLYVYRIIILFLVISLGARAPFIIILLLHFFIVFLKYKWRLLNFKNIIIVSSACFLLWQIYEKWEGAEHLKSRLENLKDISEDKSASERIVLINKSFELIADNPVLGIGIGATGYEITGKDDNLYPHNLFVETYLESGIVGFFIILLLWTKIFANLKMNHKNRIALILSLLILILFFNFMKSNSFMDARKVFIWVSIFIAFESGVFLERNKKNNEK